ncbi:MAG: Rrf2 family transcriptional regulator, partial [Defluviitaleaceae bacterium]|nr:Rrf2 family transcriptional regulator [Defluviitaleaceae bacterium]
GLVTSVRGAKGGYRLSKPPDEVTAGDALRILEGSLVPVDCVGDESAACASANCENCSTRSVWERLYAGMNEVLDTIYLSDLAADTIEIKGK